MPTYIGLRVEGTIRVSLIQLDLLLHFSKAEVLHVYYACLDNKLISDVLHLLSGNCNRPNTCS